MNKTCADFLIQIPRSLLGDLPPGEEQELLLHLADCAPCSQERAAYEHTVQQLLAENDVSVPRHFFVYPEERQATPWSLFRQLSFGWQSAMAAVLIVLAGLGWLVVSRPPAPPPLDVAALKAELTQMIAARYQEETRRWEHTLHGELARFSASLSQQQKELLRAGLTDMEARVNDRLLNTQSALQGNTDQSMTRLYQLLHEERQQDLSVVTERLNRMAARGELKSSQTDAILVTLLEAAELRIRN